MVLLIFLVFSFGFLFSFSLLYVISSRVSGDVSAAQNIKRNRKKSAKKTCIKICGLFKLFFGFYFPYESSNFTFASRIILVRFCVLFIWLNFWCTQIVPRTACEPKLVFTLLNNTPTFIRFL